MRNTFEKARAKATKKAKGTSNFMKVEFDLFKGQHFHVNILLIPLAIVVGIYDHCKNKYYHNLEWDEKKRKNCLTNHSEKYLNGMKTLVLTGFV